MPHTGYSGNNYYPSQGMTRCQSTCTKCWYYGYPGGNLMEGGAKVFSRCCPCHLGNWQWCCFVSMILINDSEIREWPSGHSPAYLRVSLSLANEFWRNVSLYSYSGKMQMLITRPGHDANSHMQVHTIDLSMSAVDDSVQLTVLQATDLVMLVMT